MKKCIICNINGSSLQGETYIKFMEYLFHKSNTFTYTKLDTENPIDNSVLDDYSNGFLITSDSFSVKQGINTQSMNFSSLNGTNLDKDKFIDFIPNKIPMFFIRS